MTKSQVKTNQNLKDRDLVNGAFIYTCIISSGDITRGFKDINMIGSPKIRQGKLFDSFNPDKQYEIKDSDCVRVDVVSVNYDFYKNTTPEVRDLINIRIETSGNDIPRLQD